MPEDRLADRVAAWARGDAKGEPPTLGPYRILEPLGTGGMGTVYRAEGPTGVVAIKVVHPHLLSTPGYFKRFLREAEIGRTIRHENVVRTLEADAIGDGDRTYHFLVMEYVEGQTTRELIAEDGPVSEELGRHIAREAAAGLAAIHAAGAVHRDLKPSNLMITADHTVKIMDLGVARLAEEAVRLSQTGDFLGSIPYAAPEQFADRDAVDYRADLYGLGGLVYEILAGEPPFARRDNLGLLHAALHEEPVRLSRRNPQVSPFLEEVVHTLLAKRPEDRFESATEVRAVLGAGEASPWWRKRMRTLRVRTARPLRRIRVPRETGLYGREEELDLLRTLYDRAVAGDGQVLLIEGEAGVGKSRLVDEFTAGLLATGEDFDFLFGSYPPGGAATPAGAISSAYREHLGIVDLEPTLEELLPDCPGLVPAFAGLLSGVPARAGIAPLDRDAAMTCFVGVTRALAAKRPLVILIDDLHFASEEGRAMFAALSLAVPGHRALLLGTYRPGMREPWIANVERLDHAGRIVLRRLGPKDLVRLLNEAFHSPILAEDLAAKVALKSDGNPFFVFEIVRGLREGGYITQSDAGDWTIAKDVKDLDIPSSVLDLVLARVADLEEEERELLDVAACIGFEFAPALAVDVAGHPRVPGLRILARIERRHRLVRSVGPKCVFDHHQIQEALYRALPEPLREEYHAAIAGALASPIEGTAHDPAEADGGLAAEICEQHVRSRHGERAEPWLMRAVEHLQGASRPERALTLLRGALGEGAGGTPRERADLLIPAAELEMLLGHPDRARDLYAEALDLVDGAPDADRQTRILTGLADVETHLGNVEEAERHVERAVELAEANGDPAIRARVRIARGHHLHRRNDREAAQVQYRAARDLFEETGDPVGVAKATANLGILAWDGSDLPRAREQLEAALAVVHEAGDRKAEATIIGVLGLVHDDMGNFREAASMHERHLEICRGIGYRRGIGIATSNLGNSLRSLGRLADASRCFAESERISAEIGDASGVMSADLSLGPVLRELGRFREARLRLVRAVREAIALEERREEGTAWYQLAITHQYAGRPARALRVARRARRRHEERGSRADALWSTLVIGTTLVDLGRTEEAGAELEPAIGAAREIDLPPLLALLSVQLMRAGALPVATAEKEVTKNLERLSPTERVETFYALWKASGSQTHRERMRESLAKLTAGLPAEAQVRLRRNWTLVREVERES